MLRDVEQIRSDLWEADISGSTGAVRHYFQYGETAAEAIAGLRERAAALAVGRHAEHDVLAVALADAARYGTGGD